MVVELTGAGALIVYRELPEDDLKVRQPDISKARKDLDWYPTIELREGLQRPIEYFSGVVRTRGA